MIEVYSRLGGMVDDDLDSICFTFWTIEKILERNKQDSEYIFFADFLLDSHWYGFKCENEDVSSIHIHLGGNQFEKLADSFDEFFENYLTRPEEYYLFGRENTEKILL